MGAPETVSMSPNVTTETTSYSITSLPKLKVCGFECHAMRPALKHYPDECFVGNDSLITSEWGDICWSLKRMEEAEEEAKAEAEAADDDDIPLYVEVKKAGWSYLFPMETASELRDFIENYSAISEELDE
jgi:hypothetical protein